MNPFGEFAAPWVSPEGKALPLADLFKGVSRRPHVHKAFLSLRNVEGTGKLLQSLQPTRLARKLIFLLEASAMSTMSVSGINIGADHIGERLDSASGAATSHRPVFRVHLPPPGELLGSLPSDASSGTTHLDIVRNLQSSLLKEQLGELVTMLHKPISRARFIAWVCSHPLPRRFLEACAGLVGNRKSLHEEKKESVASTVSSSTLLPMTGHDGGQPYRGRRRSISSVVDAAVMNDLRANATLPWQSKDAQVPSLVTSRSDKALNSASELPVSPLSSQASVDGDGLPSGFQAAKPAAIVIPTSSQNPRGRRHSVDSAFNIAAKFAALGQKYHMMSPGSPPTRTPFLKPPPNVRDAGRHIRDEEVRAAQAYVRVPSLRSASKDESEETSGTLLSPEKLRSLVNSTGLTIPDLFKLRHEFMAEAKQGLAVSRSQFRRLMIKVMEQLKQRPEQKAETEKEKEEEASKTTERSAPEGSASAGNGEAPAVSEEEGTGNLVAISGSSRMLDEDLRINRSLVADQLFTLFDINDDGSLDFHEFCIGMSRLVSGNTEEKLALLFSIFDRDGDGCISITELTRIIVNRAAVVEAVERASLDHDVEAKNRAVREWISWDKEYNIIDLKPETKEFIAQLTNALDIDGDG